MQTFKSYKAGKLKDAAFHAFFEKECHVCRITMSMIEKLQLSGKKEEAMSALGISEKAIRDLEDADYCDPALVIKLCKYLGIEPPTSCPRP